MILFEMRSTLYDPELSGVRRIPAPSLLYGLILARMVFPSPFLNKLPISFKLSYRKLLKR